MTDTPPGGPRSGGLIGDILGRVLSYMDAPWKVVAIVVLAVLGGLGFAAWEERAFLREVLLRRPGPVILRSDVSAPLDSLLADTTVDLAMVWGVDLSRNIQQLVLARQRGGGAWSMTPARLPVFVETSDPAQIVRMLRGSAVCGDPLGKQERILFRRLAEDGIRYICAVPIPPGPNSPLVGLLYFAWKTPPEPAIAATAKADAAADATDMTMR
jgi:hypothetical protein